MSEHGEYEAAVAVSVDIDAGISTVWRSLDGASDPKSTLDVSGVSRSDRVIGLLARSTDRGRRRELVRGPGAMAGETPTAGSAVTTTVRAARGRSLSVASERLDFGFTVLATRLNSSVDSGYFAPRGLVPRPFFADRETQRKRARQSGTCCNN